MSSEFELIRIKEGLDKLKREQDQLKFNLTRLQRDELAELERVRRDYASKIGNLESRQVAIMSEMKNAQLKHDQQFQLVEEEKRREAADKQKKRDEEKRGKYHL